MYKRLTILTVYCMLFILSLTLVACIKHPSTNNTPTTSPNINTPVTLTDLITDQDSSTYLIRDNSSDKSFPLKAYDGQLGLQVEFDFDRLSYISLISPMQESTNKVDIEPIILDEQYTQYIKQNLFWLDLDFAKVDLPLFTTHPILITLFVNNEEYELTYELNLNAYKIGKDYYYADHQVAEMMHLYFNPDSKLSKIAMLKQLYTVEAEKIDDEPLYFYEHMYEFERFNINNLDYHGWYKLVVEHPDTEQISLEFNIAVNNFSPLLYNAQLDILFSDALYFFSDQFETIDGIKVGLSKEEVLKQLGQPNYKTSVRWSYFIGDFLKFHLYFVDNHIEVISLTLPV